MVTKVVATASAEYCGTATQFSDVETGTLSSVDAEDQVVGFGTTVEGIVGLSFVPVPAEEDTPPLFHAASLAAGAV
jgi:hypothetical protein